VNNVVQEPGSGKAYTATGTTLTLSAALTNGTDEMYCVFLGRAVGTVNSPAGSVGTSQLIDLNVTTGKIAADAITNAKIADDAISDEQLDPTVITGQTAETSIATDDLILLSDTSASGALRKMTRANFVSGLGGLEVANSWYVSSDAGANANTETKVTSFATQTTGTGNVFSNSSGTFTAPSTGIYLVIASFACYTTSFAPYVVSRIKKGGSVRSTSQNAIYSESAGNRWSQLVTTGIIDITNTSSDTLTFHFQPANTSATIENGNTSQVQFIKLAET
jgi:hypothetical protein